MARALKPMEELVHQFLGDFGWMAMIALLLASGFGVPIGEEVVNVPAGIFVGQGEMVAWKTFLAAYVGVLGGDFLWFSICRHFGKRLLHRKWFRRFVHPRRLLEAVLRGIRDAVHRTVHGGPHLLLDGLDPWVRQRGDGSVQRHGARLAVTHARARAERQRRLGKVSHRRTSRLLPSW